MFKELELTKREFHSQTISLYKKDQYLTVEDSQFQVFTDILFEYEILNSPGRIARNKGVSKRSNWSLLGYTVSNLILDENDNDENKLEEDASENNVIQIPNKVYWEYQFINGFFSEKVDVEYTLKEEITKCLNETIKFIEISLEGQIIKDICETSDLQSEIHDAYTNQVIERLEIVIISDKIFKLNGLEKNTIIKGIKVNIQYWDLEKINELKRNKSKRLPIVIDFSLPEYRDYKIDFVKHKVDDTLTQYLAIFPANLIADLYFEHKSKLLENNVRLFLSTNRKANSEMRKSLQHKPNYFFSLNNGLSATAENILLQNDKINRIIDFQIVNGGQTTATLDYAVRYDNLSLDRVNIPVKITELRRNDIYSETVNLISKAANTQTAIRSSDFHANNLFLIQIERLSQKNPTYNSRDNHNLYFFFERMSGQYNVAISNINLQRNRKSKIEAWINEHRKEISFTKIEVARWYNCMEGLPHIAALSAEKQFTNFMEEKDFKRVKMHLGNFKSLLGFGMIFYRIRKLIGTAKGKEYPSLIDDSSVGMSTTIYAASYFHLITQGKFDYWSVYQNELGVINSLLQKSRTESEIDEVLISIINESWRQLKNFGKTSAQEKSKSEDCWIYFKINFKLNNSIIEYLKPYIITDDVKYFRDNYDQNDQDKTYFEILNTFLKGNGEILKSLEIISSRENLYKVENFKILNLIRRIENGDQLLNKNKLIEIFEFYNKIKGKGIILNEITCLNIQQIDYLNLYEKAFKQFDIFIQQLENYLLSDETKFENNFDLIEEIKGYKSKLERENGLTIFNMQNINKVINLIN